ncbi:hypothetical protein AEGHOMDF_5815 [Methylobacterium soli]|nr:hypothetical protein AEGHOMDF_5815 [Methylobacterium soli]
MSGRALHHDAVARGSRDGRDDADGQVLRLQHRPLLDMDLQIAEHVRRGAGEAPDPLGIEAELRQRVAQADPVAILAIEGGRLEASREGPRARQRHGKAHALLVPEGQHLDGEGHAEPGLMKGRDCRDRRDDAERAVVAARIAHRVDMRAEEQGRCARPIALVAPDHRAGRVERHPHARLLHPGADLTRGSRVGRREEQAGEQAGLVREPGEDVEACHHGGAEARPGGGGCGVVRPAHRA